jgi:hypothetical protein
MKGTLYNTQNQKALSISNKVSQTQVSRTCAAVEMFKVPTPDVFNLIFTKRLRTI